MLSTRADETAWKSIPAHALKRNIFKIRLKQIYVVNSSDIMQVPLFSDGARMPVRRVVVSCLINLSNYDVTR